jgi:hypothetical protein
MPEPDLRGLSVVVVDDHEDTLDLYKIALEQCGARVMIFTSAVAAGVAMRAYRPHVLVSVGLVTSAPPHRTTSQRGPVSPDPGDFTRVSERLLAYDIVHMLNRYFRKMGEAIFRNGGHIDKYMGDGLMALFGLEGAAALAMLASRRSARALTCSRSWMISTSTCRRTSTSSCGSGSAFTLAT